MNYDASRVLDDIDLAMCMEGVPDTTRIAVIKAILEDYEEQAPHIATVDERMRDAGHIVRGT